VRVYYALSVGPELDEAGVEKLNAVWQRYPDDPLLKAGAIKIMVDGVIESYTAAMLAPYSTRPVSGEPMWTSQQLDRVVAMLDRRGWQIMIHAIGDRGIRMSLDAYERAAAANPAPARGRRHRVEHIETTDPADIPRFGKLGVIASLEPFHANPSQNQIAVWEANVGPGRAARGWAYGSISAGGGRLAFGSDWPVVTLDPRFGVNMAVNRTTPEGTPAGGWHARERVPLRTALDAYTSGAAYASYDEQRKGTIAPGMLADLVVMTRDMIGLPSARFLDAEVAVTVFDGKVVYERR
jgi:predicted amidohydrolase YtcJ